MGQAITNAFITYLRDCKVNSEPVILDEIVLANIPGLNPDAPIDQAAGLPAASRIVHRHAVDQRGRINTDAVTYSIVMDTTIGDFDFNAMYLINRERNIVGMVVTKGVERKVASNIDTGKTGNSIVKSMVMSYRGAASATVTTVDASTWQIDYAARLRGMDEDVRLTALRAFGPVSFQGDAFKMSREGNTIKVQPGVAFVGGLRAQLDEVKTLSPATPWTGVYLDIHRAGSVLDAWVSHFSLRMSQTHLADYVDGQGYQHYVARVGHLNELGVITDNRTQRQLRVDGDAQGCALLDADGDVVVTLQVLDDSHEHTIATIKGLQPALDSKAQVGHTHSPSESGAAPALHGHSVEEVWGLQADLDSKSNVGHTHTPNEIGASPVGHVHRGSLISPIYKSNVNLDEITEPGSYKVNFASGTEFPGRGTGGTLLVCGGSWQGDSGTVMQLYAENGAGTDVVNGVVKTIARCYLRIFHPSDYSGSGWCELLTTDNSPAQVASSYHGSQEDAETAELGPLYALSASGATDELERRLGRAARRVAPLQDAKELGLATQEELTSLEALQRYRVALMRLPQNEGWPMTIKWPESPQ